MRERQVGSLSLDLDNLWTYMRIHGDTGWERFPSYLDVVVPRFLEFLADRDLTITVFVVGKDATIESNVAALRS
ncbi:MAG: polysaccharide deacetylase, partial [Actinomycetota bacterium]|nr:polysaccharide deacetylase [Actinomycetota bacterium]